MSVNNSSHTLCCLCCLAALGIGIAALVITLQNSDMIEKKKCICKSGGGARNGQDSMYNKNNKNGEYGPSY